MKNPTSGIQEHFLDCSRLAIDCATTLEEPILCAVSVCINALHHSGKIVLFGNGGSAAEAQHIAAEFLCRYDADRDPIPALTLTTDTSTITAIANDVSYEDIFSRQISVLVSKNDAVIGLSTSGTSLNVINGLRMAYKMDASTVLLTSDKLAGEYPFVCTHIRAPSKTTAYIQVIHTIVGHIIVEQVEKILKKERVTTCP